MVVLGNFRAHSLDKLVDYMEESYTCIFQDMPCSISLVIPEFDMVALMCFIMIKI